MEDKVAALKSKRDNADEDDANSGRSDNKGAQTVEKKKAQSWNTTNYWKYVDSLLVELEGNPKQDRLTAEQHKKKYKE